jgi:hypothetical protein
VLVGDPVKVKHKSKFMIWKFGGLLVLLMVSISFYWAYKNNSQ